LKREPSFICRTVHAVDRFLVRGIAVSLACLFVAQALLLNPTLRQSLSIIDQLEGKPIEASRRVSPEPAPRAPAVIGGMTVRLENGENRNAVLLVNGEEVSTFARGSVTTQIRAGDLVEIDGGMRQERLVFRITSVTAGISVPFEGQTIETKGTIEIVGRVRSK